MKRLLNNVVSMVACMAVALLTWGAGSVLAASQQPSNGNKLAHAAEHKNMQLVGTNDLQARSTYQPWVQKQGNRYILYAGHHALANNPVTGQQLPSLNPLTGKNEPNGTSIVDVTDPGHPAYLAHIPVGAPVNPPANPTAGGAQMVRVCERNGNFYLLRSYANSAHEIWNVTKPEAPVAVHTVAGGNPVVGGLTGTHKSWWECDTGIAYIVGHRATDPEGVFGPGNYTMIFDLSNPEAATIPFLRNWALDGQQPGGVIPPNFNAVPSIHGPISTGPDSANNPIKGTGATVNRVYFAFGTGSNGVMQVVDRTNLLPPPFGTGNPLDYKTAEVGRWVMNPINGSHTSFPIGTFSIPDWQANAEGVDRDFVAVTSEETDNECTGPRHLLYLVDVSEFLITRSNTTVSHPQSQANSQVFDSEGDFCNRGGRFGPHATNEEFGPPFYQKIVFVSYFNAGIRAIDVRDPFTPKEVAFYIPATNDNTDYRCTDNNNPSTCKIAIQTNNVATDDRGYIYIVDRANTGLHVLQLTGPGLDPLK